MTRLPLPPIDEKSRLRWQRAVDELLIAAIFPHLDDGAEPVLTPSLAQPALGASLPPAADQSML